MLALTIQKLSTTFSVHLLILEEYGHFVRGCHLLLSLFDTSESVLEQWFKFGVLH